MQKINEELIRKIIAYAAFALTVLASALLLITGSYIKNLGACVVGGIVLAFCLYGVIKWFFKEFKENN